MRGGLSPFGALVRGLIAGAAGAAAQSVFFRLTGPITPSPPRHAFTPPEPQQQEEQAIETTARRIVEQLAQRPAMSAEAKASGGVLVHYAFGAAWGGLYGLARESLRGMKGPAGMVGFATTVWMLSDNLLMPLLRLGGWPNAYPPRVHAYAWAAHVAYGAAVAASYDAVRPLSWPALAAGLWTLRARRRLPARLRPVLSPAVDAAGKLRGLARTAGAYVLH